MKCKECGTFAAYHWSGLCGICADWHPSPGAKSGNQARMADSLKRHANSVEFGERRDRDDEGMYAPGGGGTGEAERLAAQRNILPTDQYGNVLDGGEMD